MLNIIVWIILTFFLLITPDKALAEWNGLSTAAPDYLNTDDGKTWTYEIGNDGTVYQGGEQVNLTFGAYWCRYSNTSYCDGASPDFKNVYTLQDFTISAPAPGDSTAPDKKTFNITDADYPCGRVQVDIVPDPNQNVDIPKGAILGGGVHDTLKTCPPDEPTNLSASCTQGTGTFSWTSGIGADSDDLRIDYNPASWNGSCSNPIDPGKDLCFGPPASPGNVNNMASGTYDWWVDSCNSGGCKTRHGSELLTCSIPVTSISVTPTSITKSTSWPALTLTINTNDPAASRVTVCKVSSTNNCASDVGEDITGSLSPSALTKDGVSHNYSWTPPSTNTAGTYYFAVYPAGTPKLARSNSVDFRNPVVFDFIVSSPGNVSLIKGSTNTGHTITVTKTQGIVESVTLSFNGNVGGTVPTFNPTSCIPNSGPTSDTCQSTLTFNTSSATAGIYSNLKINGTSASRPAPGVDSAIFTLTITAPDLTVDSLSPSGSVAAGAVTFSGRVVNNGNADANSSSTRLRIDTNNDNSWDTITTNQPTGALTKNGGSETETWSNVWTAPPCISGTCSHKYEICTNTPASTSFTESNPNNNCTSQTVSVVPSSGPCPTATEGYSCSSSLPGTNCSLKSAYTCSVSGESCYFCSPPLAPTVSTVRVTNSCINPNHSGSDVDISWTNPGVNWVNISTDSAFGSYYHKNVTGLSTTAPNGFNLNPSNPPQQLTLNPAPSIYYARTYNSTQNSHSQTAVFSINSCTTTAAFDYSLSNSGPITVKQGLSGANTITRTLVSGTPSGVFLSASGLPSGASSSFTSNPSSPTFSSTLTISTSPTTPVGSYNITVTGSPLSKTTVFPLTVTLATGPCNGNKTCDGGETILTCPTDCKPPVCPDKICEAGETTASCPQDCPAGGPSCGNNTCEGNEPVTCPTDCPGPRRSKPWIQIKGDVHSNTGIR